MSPPLAALVLAAGAGTRFGGGKALARWGGVTLLERVVAAARDGGCDPVLVVVGADDRVAAEAARLGAVPVPNPEWASGIASSLRAGLVAAPPACAGVVVLLADQPLLSGAAVRRVAAAVTTGAGGATAARASYAGHGGHPVAFTRGVIAAVAASVAGDVGAGPWLRAHAAQVVDVDCTDLGDPRDVDTPAELAALDDP